jgi:glycosyltransferase involved in cell wall biosynthesis
MGVNCLVSIILAAYNAEKYIAETIKSVLKQTFCNFELILINDGSNDGTGSIIKKYEAFDRRLRCYSQKNMGPGSARNFGLSKSKGDWIAIIDADDLWRQDKLSRQIAFIKEHPGIVLLGTGFSQIDSDGHFVKTYRYPSDHESLLHRLERKKEFFPHSASLYKANVVQQLDGYRYRFEPSEDRDLWLRISEKGKMACLYPPLVQIRKHKNQISHINGGRQQLIAGYAATVSYFIRKLGGKDPLENKYKIDFFKWIERQLEQEEIFDRRSAWSRARLEYYTKPNRLSGILRFGEQLLGSGYFLKLLWKKLFGTDLPYQLAKKWMNISST